MSRIQDILAKAERDGTARRTHTEPVLSAPTAVVAPIDPPSREALRRGPVAALAETDGAVALKSSFMPAPTPMSMPVSGPVAVQEPPAVESHRTIEARTAHATLHPALVAAIAPHSAAAERYRAVRTRLTMREESGPLRTTMITSPGARDGKSVTAANLALTMAQEVQRNVVLVDADLRNPAAHSLFGIDGGPGLGDVLAGDATLEDALVYLPDYRLTILPAGTSPQFPTELLGSAVMRRTLDTLRAKFDRILLDLPAVAPLADVSTVAPLTDGVVMVVRAGVTQRPALEQALAVFDEDKVLGIVLNDAK